MVIHVSVHPPAPRAGDAPAGQAIGLVDEHAEPLKQVAVRAEALLAVAAAGRWSARELEALLGYLRGDPQAGGR